MVQRTILEKVEFSGVGIHTGEEVTIILHPEGENSGISFYREGVRIPLSPESVVNFHHSTDLGSDGVVIKTVEHLLSTLHLLGVTNLTVEVKGGCEIPIMDGSGQEFYRSLKDIVADQSESQEVFVVEEEVEVSNGSARVIATPYEGFEVTYEGGHDYLGSFSYTYKGDVDDIIRARTYCFDYEVEFILKSGLGKGGSLDNTLIIGKDKVYNEGGFRYENEPARHKVFDLIGDLYLLGMPVRGKFLSVKGGHHVNVALVKELYKRSVLV